MMLFIKEKNGSSIIVEPFAREFYQRHCLHRRWLGWISFLLKFKERDVVLPPWCALLKKSFPTSSLISIEHPSERHGFIVCENAIYFFKVKEQLTASPDLLLSLRFGSGVILIYPFIQGLTVSWLIEHKRFTSSLRKRLYVRIAQQHEHSKIKTTRSLLRDFKKEYPSIDIGAIKPLQYSPSWQHGDLHPTNIIHNESGYHFIDHDMGGFTDIPFFDLLYVTVSIFFTQKYLNNTALILREVIIDPSLLDQACSDPLVVVSFRRLVGRDMTALDRVHFLLVILLRMKKFHEKDTPVWSIIWQKMLVHQVQRLSA